MPYRMTFLIEINGVKYRWSEILKMRREQRKAKRQPQPTLFEMKDDTRPAAQANAAQRYEEPPLFKL